MSTTDTVPLRKLVTYNVAPEAESATSVGRIPTGTGVPVSVRVAASTATTVTAPLSVT